MYAFECVYMEEFYHEAGKSNSRKININFSRIEDENQIFANSSQRMLLYQSVTGPTCSKHTYTRTPTATS